MNRTIKCKAWVLASVAYIFELLYVEVLLPFLYTKGIVVYNNAFTKQEKVAFDQLLEGFQDALVLSNLVSVYRTESTDMERTSNAANGIYGTIWRPQPYISQSFAGTDQSLNYADYMQLSVPARISFPRSVPWVLSATELRDALQANRLGESAKQKLASDINVQVNSTACNGGSLIVKRTTSASGFDDIAACEAIMNEQGVQNHDRKIALSTRDYNGMASNLAARQTMTGKPTTAFEKALVGEIASFETYKMDYSPRLTAAAAAGVTITNTLPLYYTPSATLAASSGDVVPVDNRYQNISIAVTSGAVKVGDAFVLAAVNAVHHITKQDTGQLKTFRIAGIISGGGGAGIVTITPPIISGTGATAGEIQYQNVTAAPANNAAITFLNTVNAYCNPFWQKDAIELLPGHYEVPTDAGVAVMRGSTDQGIELVMQKFYNIDNMKTKFRLDTLFGTCLKQPEMAGLMLFSQT